MITSEEYVNRLGSCCPNCESTDISGSEVDISAGAASQVVTCQECDWSWTDTYLLNGYVELEAP